LNQDPGDRRICVQLRHEGDRVLRGGSVRDLHHPRPDPQLLAQGPQPARVHLRRLVPSPTDDRELKRSARHLGAELVLERGGDLAAVKYAGAHPAALFSTTDRVRSTSSRPPTRAPTASRRSRHERANSSSSTPARLSRTFSSADARAAPASSAPTAASLIRNRLPSSAARSASSSSSAQRSATASGTSVLSRRAASSAASRAALSSSVSRGSFWASEYDPYAATSSSTARSSCPRSSSARARTPRISAS